MTRVHAGGRTFAIEAVVFDKDGLLFKSKAFWIALAEERLKQIRYIAGAGAVQSWADCFGVKTEDGVSVSDVDATGIMAVASPAEEMTATAALLVQALGLSWTQAREQAFAIFQKADEQLDLRRALQPQKGFPQIMERLREKGIPYGVATSDTTERVIQSFRLFDDPNALAFIISPREVSRGKPYPDMLERIASQLQVPLGRLLMVGDSYVDVQMAHSAGAIGIGIPETEEMRRQMLDWDAVIVDSLEQIFFE